MAVGLERCMLSARGAQTVCGEVRSTFTSDPCQTRAPEDSEGAPFLRLRTRALPLLRRSTPSGEQAAVDRWSNRRWSEQWPTLSEA